MDDRAAEHDHAGAAARRAILAGDDAGLRAFYDAQLRPLYAFCWHRLGRDHHAAEEVVQETMTAAIERIAEYDPGRGAMHVWLALLARNAIRRANEARRRSLPLDAGGDPPDGDGGVAARREERAAEVGLALDRLPPRYRAVLERKYLRGESVRAIAAAERTTEKAVESMLARAREAFRDEYAGDVGVVEAAEVRR